MTLFEMNWMDMDLPALKEAMKELGEPAFRAGQVFSWLQKGRDFSEMTNLSAALREKLAQTRPLGGVRILERVISPSDGTAKYLFLLEDGNIVEGVLMHHKHGKTICVSTQVGCRMGCTFCASTLNGLVRNLRPGEMLSTVASVNREQMELEGQKDGRAITNIVLMGSGEPLDNYDNVLAFLRLVNAKDGLNISYRNISLSTCGIVPRMRELAESGVPVTLSVSLHSPEDEQRRKLMPIANRYAVAEVVDAAKYYVETTGRRVIFEYALIRGTNDTPEYAQKLAALLKGFQCHVNLIPLNEVKERGMRGTAKEDAKRFLEALSSLGVSATIRREMGADIEGACGQLRRRYLADRSHPERGEE
ncbi:MAG: 23S rRNA (adenine(2503)-C(2))-methyltransferase RlmN [Christensenellales bacterium]|jgi:23S rRNA (adenine2503-C2)-methyltransferase